MLIGLIILRWPFRLYRIGLFQKKSKQVKKYFFEKTPGFFRFVTLEILEKTQLNLWKTHRNATKLCDTPWKF